MSRKVHRSRAALGASLVVLSSVFYGLYGVWTTLMGDAFASYQQALIRSLIVVACLTPIVLWRKQWRRIHWRRDAKWLLLSVLSSALVSGPLYYATLRVGVGMSMALAYAGIVVGMFVFGWMFSRERYTKEKFISTFLAFVGLVLIFSPTVRHLGILALGAAFVSGLASGLNVTASKHMPYSGTQSTLIAWLGGIVANVAMILLTGQAHHHIAFGISWLYLFLFALTALASSWSVVSGVKYIDGGSAGILGLLEILFGVAFGVLFFAERPRPVVLAGMATIMVAAAIPYFYHFRLRAEPVTS